MKRLAVRWLVVGWGAAFLLLTEVVIHLGFLGDDLRFVYEVEQVHSIRGFVNYIIQPLGASFVWRPFVNLFWYLERGVFGTNPGLFHAMHLMLYAAAAWLLYMIIKRIGGQYLGAATAALFFFTPYHLEALAWLSSMTDLLAILGSLAAIYLLMCYRDSAKNATLVWSGVVLLLALFSKEFALATPIAMLLIDVLFFTNVFRKRFFKVYGLLLGMTSLYLALRYAVLGNFLGSNTTFAQGFLGTIGLGKVFLAGIGLLAILAMFWYYAYKSGKYKSPKFWVVICSVIGAMAILGGIALVVLTDSLTPFKQAVGSFTFLVNHAVLSRLNGSVADFWLRWRVYATLLGFVVLFALNVGRFRQPKFLKLVGLGLGLTVLYSIPTFPLMANIDANLQHTRFLYAPSVGLALLLAVLLVPEEGIWRRTAMIKKSLLGVLTAGFLCGFILNIPPWIKASNLMTKVIDNVESNFTELAHAQVPTRLYVHSLPGSVDGAFAFHDLYSFREAFNIRFRNDKVAIVPVGRYESSVGESLCQPSSDTSVHLLQWKTDHFELKDDVMADWLSIPSGKTFGFDSEQSFMENGWQVRDLTVKTTDSGMQLSDFQKNSTLEAVLPVGAKTSNFRFLEMNLVGEPTGTVQLYWQRQDGTGFGDFQNIPISLKDKVSVPLCQWTNWMVGGEISAISLKFSLGSSTKPFTIKNLRFY